MAYSQYALTYAIAFLTIAPHLTAAIQTNYLPLTRTDEPGSISYLSVITFYSTALFSMDVSYSFHISPPNTTCRLWLFEKMSQLSAEEIKNLQRIQADVSQNRIPRETPLFRSFLVIR